MDIYAVHIEAHEGDPETGASGRIVFVPSQAEYKALRLNLQPGQKATIRQCTTPRATPALLCALANGEAIAAHFEAIEEVDYIIGPPRPKTVSLGPCSATE